MDLRFSGVSSRAAIIELLPKLASRNGASDGRALQRRRHRPRNLLSRLAIEDDVEMRRILVSKLFLAVISIRPGVGSQRKVSTSLKFRIDQ